MLAVICKWNESSMWLLSHEERLDTKVLYKGYNPLAYKWQEVITVYTIQSTLLQDQKIEMTSEDLLATTFVQ